MSETKKTWEEYNSISLISELPEMVKRLDNFRAGNTEETKKKPVDISLEELVKESYGVSEQDFFKKIGINTKVDTMANVFTMPDPSVRWVVPEIIRSAVTLGIRTAPFYPNLITSDQPISQLSAIMPYVNFSDADPAKINEAETIPLGTISYGQKNVGLFKIGKGLKITDEVRDYVSLDVMAIYFRDFGVRLGYALDSLAIDTAINGNKVDGSESAPVIGVRTVGSYTYKDLLRLWVRAARLGRNFTTIIGGEDTAIDLLDLPEFKVRQQGTTEATLIVHSPIPNRADFYIHPGIPDDQVMMIDKSAAMIKLTAKALMMESERIVSNQTQATYATLTTGFAKMYQDATIMMDRTQSFNGFPSFMNLDEHLIGILE